VVVVDLSLCETVGMKFPEHLTLSYLIAQFGIQQQYGTAGTILVLAAGNLPDLDGLTLFAGQRVYRNYHRVLGHGLPITLAGPFVLAWLGSRFLNLGAFWPLWAWLQIALLAHLLTDVCFYRWPVQLLWPLSRQGWGYGLVRWNDLIPTLILYSATVLAFLLPAFATLIAVAGIGIFALYLGWRAWWPWPYWGWAAWITGSWAPRAAPFWRWLTGDFIT
jgi:membrane-bound metal-dependent hydrolase YbcI (DUF457 family)